MYQASGEKGGGGEKGEGWRGRECKKNFGALS